MGDFFGTIYSWFQSLWCDNLNLYLWGYEPATQSYSGTNIYNIAGLVTVIVALVVVLVYYYIINHPRWCKWWSWLITLLLNSVVGLFVAFGMSYSNYINGYIKPTIDASLVKEDTPRSISQPQPAQVIHNEGVTRRKEVCSNGIN